MTNILKQQNIITEQNRLVQRNRVEFDNFSFGPQEMAFLNNNIFKQYSPMFRTISKHLQFYLFAQSEIHKVKTKLWVTMDKNPDDELKTSISEQYHQELIPGCWVDISLHNTPVPSSSELGENEQPFTQHALLVYLGTAAGTGNVALSLQIDAVRVMMDGIQKDVPGLRWDYVIGPVTRNGCSTADEFQIVGRFSDDNNNRYVMSIVIADYSFKQS